MAIIKTEYRGSGFHGNHPTSIVDTGNRPWRPVVEESYDRLYSRGFVPLPLRREECGIPHEELKAIWRSEKTKRKRP